MTEPTPELTPLQESVLKYIADAVKQSSAAGWRIVRDQTLIAINPSDPSELWAFFADENKWRRLGSPQRDTLRVIRPDKNEIKDGNVLPPNLQDKG